MLIGLGALIRCSTPGYCVFLSDTLVSWSLKRRIQFPIPVQRQKIGLLLMLLLSDAGCDSFFKSFMFLSQRLRSSFVIMLVQFILLPIQFIINEHKAY
jgi:hypothetical protein